MKRATYTHTHTYIYTYIACIYYISRIYILSIYIYILKHIYIYYLCVFTHTQKSLSESYEIKPNLERNYTFPIGFQHQTEIRLVQNQLEKRKYDRNLV